MASEGFVPERIAQQLRNSPLLRVAAIGILTLLLMIPIEWIGALVTERMTRRSEAVAEVSAKWGGKQTLVGPALVVPYVHRWTEQKRGGADVVRSETRQLTILPTDVRIQARIDGEDRYRGIFAVPVYRAALAVTGGFELPDLVALRVDPALVEWQRSELVVGIADARAIQNRASVVWNGVEHPFRPGPGAFDTAAGINALIAHPFASGPSTFVFELSLNGSVGLYFTPAGQQTAVAVESNWPSPSFQGSWLPAARSGGSDGFRASWEIPFLARNQAPAWTTESPGMIGKLESAAFGVDLVTPVDAHRMTDRSVKYARLFVVLTFATIWLIEVLAGVRVHPIQTLLVGCALCTFYLLELSLSEQLGFAPAYLLAASAVVLLIGLYTAVVLDGRRRAAAVALTVAGLYAYLYVLLTNEDYALLLGSIAVFIALAVTMFATRHIDWYAAAHDVTAGDVVPRMER